MQVLGQRWMRFLGRKTGSLTYSGVLCEDGGWAKEGGERQRGPIDCTDTCL